MQYAGRVGLTVNGQRIDVVSRDLSALLNEMGFDPRAKVATALNGAFVPASQREGTALSAGDHVEVLSPRQGG
ncbi:MAG: sulfur carrier protein ThiS [Pseudomonadota bacterium]